MPCLIYGYNNPMLLTDLIGVRAFPAVVQAAEVRDLLKAGNESDIHDFVTGYLGFDARSRYALSSAVASLSQTERGGAFFLNGVFGSGKSHLLGLIALLADGIGASSFSHTHPQLAKELHGARKRFVVHFSLDDYSPAELSLEGVVHIEIAREWQRRFNQELKIPRPDLRREYFATLEEQLLKRNYQGLLLCVDELSLYLSAKEHIALQADAAFLQFIGQRAARDSACPIHFFAAIQKTVDDIGDIEAYSLSQIRDRFTILPLSLAHLPSLVSLRLIVHKDPGALQKLCREEYAALCKALPRLDFTPTEWETLYPFHPTTITLLEKTVARFFSRTRSAVLFSASAAQELINAPTEPGVRLGKVLPEKVFDYFIPELETHPELHPLLKVWTQWEEEAAELVRDTGETQTLLRLMKTVLLFKIAGVAPTAVQLANVMVLDARLPDEGNYEYAQLLLERILTRGSYLAVERRETNSEAAHLSDRYTIDLGPRISDLARRHLKNSVKQLRFDDARISAALIASCQSEPMPLKSLEIEQLFSVYWKHTPRQIAVQLLQNLPDTNTLTNRLAMLETESGHAKLLLLVLAPFSSQASRRREPFPRNRRYLIWTPRLPTNDELQSAREATAANLLETDPQLLDNRRGRAVVQFLKDNRMTRQTQMARLCRRLLREGVFWFGDGRVLEASETALGEQWQSTLEAIGDLAFPEIFPKFETVAPQARALTPANVQQLCLELLRRPDDDPYFSASLDRLVRTLARPLGVATSEKGRWRFSLPHAELTRELKEQIGERSTLRALETHFARSEWGLPREQLELALCALLRNGELTASDSQGKILVPEKIGFPLGGGVHTLDPGSLLDQQSWVQLRNRLEILGLELKTPTENVGTMPEVLTFSHQRQIKNSLLQKRDELEAETELMQARLRQLQRTLNHSTAQWPTAESTLQKMAELLEQLQSSHETVPLLKAVASLDETALTKLLALWRQLHNQFETELSQLLELHRLLKDPHLIIVPPLQESYNELLHLLDAGEAFFTEESQFFGKARQWRAEYSAIYHEWHCAQHAPARWNSLRRLQNSETIRALHRLSTLRSRSFSNYHHLQKKLQNELAKQCPRDGTLLPGEATCNACNLQLNERVQLNSAQDIEVALTAEIALFHRHLQEEGIRQQLQRDAKSTLLLEWDGQAELLAPLLDDHTLSLLEEAFKPRRKIPRKLQDLTTQLTRCRTRAELESAFQNWLNGTEQPENDDEIILQ